ncbi:unnamed protein product [Echinostoma caproni]|uniref:Lipopolysaccharide choline phosphotransferase protein n=1 Tax=Echinostoma caproni TaxID=27848 RepID=A0A183AAT5_9TREM|nr:unnamed protein product [Echinostoma caproni]
MPPIWYTLDQLNLTNLRVDKIPEPILDAFLVRPFRNQTPWDRLPNLTELRWPDGITAPLPAGRRLYPRVMRAPYLPSFDPILSAGQRRLYEKLFSIFTKLMDDHGYSDRYMLSAGTLLGSHRHHDWIPWDEDVDIMVDAVLRPWLRQKLSEMAPEYQISFADRDKFFTKLLPLDQDNETDVMQSRQSTGSFWGWPFLDISYYGFNQTHMIEVTSSYGIYYAWPLDMIFPLLYRPFGQQWHPGPRDPLASLIAYYGKSDDCESLQYSHVYEKFRSQKRTKCHELGTRFAFVKHRPCLVNGKQIQWGDLMLVEEVLVRKLNDDREENIHAFCVATDSKNSKADTYALDYVE